MRKSALIVLFLLSITIGHSQQNMRDSILQALKAQKQDTTRVMLLNRLSAMYKYTKPDTAIALSLEALYLSRKIDYTRGEAVSLMEMANGYLWIGDYPTALASCLQGLKISEGIHFLNGQMGCLNSIGLVYKEQGDYREAINYYSKSKVLAEQLNSNHDIANEDVNIGQAYLYLQVYDSAKFYCQQSYNIAYSIKDIELMGEAYNNLGDIYAATREFPLALAYYQSSLSLSHKAGNDLMACYVNLGLANVFKEMNQMDSATIYGRQALYLAVGRRFSKSIPDAASLLSLIYEDKHNIDSAYFYTKLEKAANDSLFNQQKLQQLQSLSFGEKLRQIEMDLAQKKEEEQRRNNLQYRVIAFGLITFIILFLLLSHSIIANQRFIRFLGVVALLIVFEFINLLLHPYLGEITHHSPLRMLLIMVCIAALLSPLHYRIEHWITHKLVEKNNRIRLAIAKKTIEKLEGKVSMLPDENSTDTQHEL